MQPVPNAAELTQQRQSPFLLQNNSHHPHNATTTTVIGDISGSVAVTDAPSTLIDQDQNISPGRAIKSEAEPQLDQANNSHDRQTSATRFKWTNEKTQVAMNLVKYGCKPKLISVAVGCSLRTAQKFAETVTPKIEGESFKTYEIKRRGRKSKDVNQRLNAIREVLSKDSTKTQVEIAADLRVSNTTVCRDLKRIGAYWKDKKYQGNSGSAGNAPGADNNASHNNNGQQTNATSPVQQQRQPTTRKTRQSNARHGQNTNNNTNDSDELPSPKRRKRTRRANSKNENGNELTADHDQQLVATNMN